MRALVEAAIEQRDGSRACFYCGSTTPPCIDHVRARVRGGSDYIDNLVFACETCNLLKGQSPGWLYIFWRSVFAPKSNKAELRRRPLPLPAELVPSDRGD